MQLVHPDGRTLWLAYAMNVHPGGEGRTVADAIEQYVLPIRERLGAQGPFGIAPRLDAAGAADLLQHERTLADLATILGRHDLVAFTGNAFVHGRFHGRPVKDAVYHPPWGDPARTAYTLDFARVLARLAEGPGERSLSTAPGAWRGWQLPADHQAAAAREVVRCAEGLRQIEDETGVRVVLALEPEPRCTLETIDEAIAFFDGPLSRALEGRGSLRRWLGLCYDVCHQAVMHEDPAEAFAKLARAGLSVAKIQASCALEVEDPTDPEATRLLEAFDEPIWLHQVAARDARGTLHVGQDLGAAIADPSGRWRERRPWRVHFHVPVFRETLVSPLRTTQADLLRTLELLGTHDLSSHLEVETYSFSALPEAERAAGSGDELVEALVREMAFVLERLEAAGFAPPAAAQ